MKTDFIDKKQMRQKITNGSHRKTHKLAILTCLQERYLQLLHFQVPITTLWRVSMRAELKSLSVGALVLVVQNSTSD